MLEWYSNLITCNFTHVNGSGKKLVPSALGVVDVGVGGACTDAVHQKMDIGRGGGKSGAVKPIERCKLADCESTA